MQQKMSDPAACMDGCDWGDEAVGMYTNGLPAGDFEHLNAKKPAEEANGVLSVTVTSDSELKKLDKGHFVGQHCHSSQGSVSVKFGRLMKRMVQNGFCRGLVPRSDSGIFPGATLAEL